MKNIDDMYIVNQLIATQLDTRKFSTKLNSTQTFGICESGDSHLGHPMINEPLKWFECGLWGCGR